MISRKIINGIVLAFVYIISVNFLCAINENFLQTGGCFLSQVSAEEIEMEKYYPVPDDMNTIRYVTNGGLGEFNNVIKLKKDIIKIITEIPIRNGYKFLGWKSSISGKIYNSGGAYDESENSILTALWDESGDIVVEESKDVVVEENKDVVVEESKDVVIEESKDVVIEENKDVVVDESEMLEVNLKSVFEKSSVDKGQIAVIRSGQLAGDYAYKCNEDDKFEVFALSKTILGIIAAKMHQEGVIDLDQTIDTYWYALGNLDFSKCSKEWNSYIGNEKDVKEVATTRELVQNPATLRNCLTHSSTIKNAEGMYWSDSANKSGEYIAGSMGTKFTMTTFMLHHTWSQLFNSSSKGAPGTKTEYAKDKDALTREHALAGYTMQAAAHVSINEYLRDKILNPLEIYTSPEFKREGLGYFKAQVKLQGHSIYYAAGYQSSAKDIAKIIALVANDGKYNGIQILNNNTISEIEKVESNLKNQTIAFNYNNGKFERDGVFGSTVHFSEYGLHQRGWYSYLSYDPNTGDGFVVTAYGTNGNKEKLYKGMADYVYSK